MTPKPRTRQEWLAIVLIAVASGALVATSAPREMDSGEAEKSITLTAVQPRAQFYLNLHVSDEAIPRAEGPKITDREFHLEVLPSWTNVRRETSIKGPDVRMRLLDSTVGSGLSHAIDARIIGGTRSEFPIGAFSSCIYATGCDLRYLLIFEWLNPGDEELRFGVRALAQINYDGQAPDYNGVQVSLTATETK